MKVPLLRTVAVGEFSPWARQLFTSLSEKEIVEVTMEPDFVLFSKALAASVKPTVVFLENNSESKKTIEKLCESGKPIYLIWLAKSFSKEDLSLALENRFYTVIEAIKYDEKSTILNLKRLSQLVDSSNHFNQILRAMKSILLQTEAEFPDLPMVGELRNAVKRLEGQGLLNEFNHLKTNQTGENAEALFHKAQTLGEALMTIHDLERTGVLWIRGKGSDEEGKIDFFQGKVNQAVAGGCEGTKAIYRMFLWDQPRFLFNRKDPREVEVTHHLQSDINHLVKMGNFYKEKFEKIRSNIPLPGFKLEVVPGAVNNDTMIESNDFSVLSSVIEFGTVGNLVDFNDLPDVEVYESLVNLKRNNMIRRASG